MKASAVTDLDFIVRLGYSEADARHALQVTHGNRNAALYFLSKDTSSQSQRSWRKETADEWVDGNARATPNIAENRAVHKSPFYIFVEHYHTPPEGDEYIFEMEVTLRDGRQWKVGRTYPEFYTLWASLPLGSCMSFTNSFPPSAALQFVFGELSRAFLDKRLLGLCEWMRELVLNESCMGNPKVLDLLYKFTDADNNGGKPGQKQKPQQSSVAAVPPSAPPAPLPNLKSPLMMVGQDSMEAAAAKRKAAYYHQAPLLGLEQLPITPQHVMPFKINLKKLQCYHDLIGMKLSSEAKEKEDEVRRVDDAILAAAIAESAAEVPHRDELVEMERKVQHEEEHCTISLLHSHNQVTSNTVAVVPSAPLADSKEETQSLPALTCCLPPQIARAVDSATADVSALKRLQCTSILNLKIDDAQLQKDCSRDRIVVQGKRLMGADTDLDRIYALCQDSILQALAASEKKFDLDASVSVQKAETNPFADSASAHGASTNPFDDEVDTPLPVAHATSTVHATTTPLSPSTAPRSQLQQDLEHFSRVALSVISRTESGYLSHASLNEIFDMENTHQAPDFTPYFFVPESALSDPLNLTFSVLEKGGAPQAMRGKFAQPALAEEWCIECSGETSTTYRLMDAVELVPLLQIRVTYLVTLFGMPQYQHSSRVMTGLLIKEGKCQILIDKVTTTTSRDWENCT